MKVVSTVLAVLIGLLGLVFLIGSQGQVHRLVVGGVLLAAAIVLAVLPQLRPRATTVVQKIELSGDVALESLQCRSCAASLDRSAVEVRAGAVFVECPHCKTSYQLEEAPKW